MPIGLSHRDYDRLLKPLLPTSTPSPVHRLISFKDKWLTLSTITSKMKRTIFRGLYLRVDLSKIDFSAPVRSHYCTNPQDLAWARKQIHAYIKTTLYTHGL